jgi:oligoribonuclease (3'-5' exoribonuclease)
MTTHKPPPSHICWVDLETTDSDPYAEHAAVLEIGVVVTDWSPELRELGRASLLVRPPGLLSDHDAMWSRMNPKVQEMHHASGLWEAATTGDSAWSVSEADRAVTDWLAKLVLEGGGAFPVPIAGAGVGHLDQPWIKAHLPLLASKMTYWPLDISPLRRLLQVADRDDYVDMVGDVEAKPHRGLDDALLHVAEARRYLRMLGSLPPAPELEPLLLETAPEVSA